MEPRKSFLIKKIEVKNFVTLTVKDALKGNYRHNIWCMVV